MTVPGHRLTSGRGRALRLFAAAATAALAMTIPAATTQIAGAAPVSGRVSTGGQDSSARTVTGTVSGDHAWDVSTKSQLKAAPSVTVDQTRDLTDQVVHVTWKNFTPSIDNAGSFFNAGNTYYAVTVLECKGVHPTDSTYRWPNFGPDCYNYTPSDANAPDGVGNQAYTLTGPHGTGETYFHVETRDENNALGCNSTHACSLVVIPNWGGHQPAGDAPSSHDVTCGDHSDDQSFFGHYARDDSLGSGCSWADRFVIPLHFAPTPESCPAKDYAFAAEGAPMLARTMQQWQAGWCTGAKPITFDFDSGTDEYLARSSFLNGSSALTSSTDVALVNQPASGKPKGYTYAPVANSGIAISYHVDDQLTGKLITNLVLDARLVAKLVTQSYALDFGCSGDTNTSKQSATCDPAVKGNPIDIFDDPEFQKLNPEYTRADFPPDSDLNRGQFLPLVPAGESDMTYQLSRWIESDPQARAFVDGKADPWGMHVNSYYRDETMPMDQFQVLDPGYTAPESNGVPGQSTMQVSWNPISGLSNVAASLVIDRPSGIDPTLPACGGKGGVPCVYPRFSPQPPGNRGLFSVVGLADAAADRFPTAELVNAGGAAVAPTRAGLAAGVSDMRADADKITRSARYTSTDKAQYPLTMTDYAMVPTCGLKSAKAAAIKQFLSLVRSSQTLGSQPGELAAGNLALTTTQRAQTRAAETAVGTGACTAGDRHHGSGVGAKSGHHGGGTSTGGSGGGGGGGTSGTSTHGKGKKAGTSRTSKNHPAKVLDAYGVKSGDSSAHYGMVLPIVLLLSALLLIGGPGTLLLLRTSAGASALARVRRVVRR